jgi:hypothetical protein
MTCSRSPALQLSRPRRRRVPQEMPRQSARCRTAEGRQFSCRVTSGRWAGRIGGMVFSFLYIAVRTPLGALVRSRRGLDVKDIDCWCFGMSSRCCTVRLATAASTCRTGPARSCSLSSPAAVVGALVVTPRTLLRWHQGPVAAAGGDGRSCPMRCGRWCCGSRARILAGPSPDLRRACRARLPGFAKEHPSTARTGGSWNRRRGVEGRAGANPEHAGTSIVA